MTINRYKIFWMIITAVAAFFTLVIVGRNVTHTIKTRAKIRQLQREYDEYNAQIQRDSLMLRQLEEDWFLERYARENYHMQRRNEHVFLIED